MLTSIGAANASLVIKEKIKICSLVLIKLSFDVPIPVYLFFFVPSVKCMYFLQNGRRTRIIDQVRNIYTNICIYVRTEMNNEGSDANWKCFILFFL